MTAEERAIVEAAKQAWQKGATPQWKKVAKLVAITNFLDSGKTISEPILVSGKDSQQIVTALNNEIKKSDMLNGLCYATTHNGNAVLVSFVEVEENDELDNDDSEDVN